MISFGAEKLGYIHPPEWFPQVATWLSWPHNQETWRGEELALAQKEYANLIAQISKGAQGVTRPA